jgi:hypothetical protein
MIAPLILLLSLAGMMLNLSLSGLVIQPDWSAALLLSAILAQRGNWTWVLPGFWIHDLALHWSSLVCLPVIALLPFLLAQSDARLGPGLPQRITLMVLGLLPLLWAGWSFSQWLLTAALTVFTWHYIAKVYAKSV